SQNMALFSLLGTTYGGDGKSTFALPNLQGSVPLQAGQGNGLTLRELGVTGGEQAVTLLDSEMPAHTHGLMCSNAAGTQASPSGGVWAVAGTRGSSLNAYAGDVNAGGKAMSPQALTLTGD